MKRKLKRMWRQATADKTKFGLLVTCVLVGLLLWGRLILLEKVPRHATADPKQADSPSAEAPDPAGGPVSTAVLSPLPEVRTDLGDELALNLFAFRHDRYRLLPQENSGDTGVTGTQISDDERKQMLVEKAKDLRLQSVVQGATPLIVINGRVLRVGDSIDGFEIVSFTERSAKVTRDGLTFKLTMLSD